ncbi:MAG: MBL fold metallo-hydrolase [Sulfurimonas sp.]|uniref:MBL fold metallo-hydrolase RNA specificity domain-containing protein n=1 Tax=Sulfurimonas sp. TaxID=2022749 RepID=UPI0025DFAF7E|nr:MBL fold metallo-hydrolase [Sulfurimonas sp.]MCK9491004.1 MBL fold metallo-hydrolase [Sulfurimonas sp.]
MNRVTPYGAAQSVTGSCHLVELLGLKILIDCGMFQGEFGLEKNYDDFEFDVNEIDYLIITHGHLDHIGRVPKLVKDGFNGVIIATQATKEIANIMLNDSAKILKEEYKTLRRKAKRRGDEKRITEPLYTIDHVKEVFLKEWQILEYRKELNLSKDVAITFGDAGHILGSAFVMIDYKDKESKKRVVFSGDIGSKERMILDPLDTLSSADTLFIESTYGDRNHRSLKESIKEFKETVINTLKRDGNVIIPSFAIERTQEILWLLNNMQADGELPKCQVFLDSPLATKATRLYAKYPVHLNEELELHAQENGNPFKFASLNISATKQESLLINKVKSRAIIIAGSGMCHGGRIMHHLKHRLWNEKNCVIFVGFQVEGTLGREIINGYEYVKIYGEDIIVKAQVETINGFSAHAGQNDMIEWMSNIRDLKNLYLIHGEKDKMKIFTQKIKEELDLDAKIVKYAEIVEL